MWGTETIQIIIVTALFFCKNMNVSSNCVCIEADKVNKLVWKGICWEEQYTLHQWLYWHPVSCWTVGGQLSECRADHQHVQGVFRFTMSAQFLQWALHLKLWSHLYFFFQMYIVFFHSPLRINQRLLQCSYKWADISSLWPASSSSSLPPLW